MHSVEPTTCATAYEIPCRPAGASLLSQLRPCRFSHRKPPRAHYILNVTVPAVASGGAALRPAPEVRVLERGTLEPANALQHGCSSIEARWGRQGRQPVRRTSALRQSELQRVGLFHHGGLRRCTVGRPKATYVFDSSNTNR